MSTLYLVRHGQASFGTDNYDQLSPRAASKWKLLGQFFVESGEKIDRIYSGSLQRQRETADMIAAASASRSQSSVDDAFDEYDSDIILRRFAASLSPEELTERVGPS